jgi:hypothetical protein
VLFLRIYPLDSHSVRRKAMDIQTPFLPPLDALEQKLYAGIYPLRGAASEDNTRITAGWSLTFSKTRNLG